MREILFRGQRCDNNEWVQGFYVRADHHWHKHGIHKDWIICGASANGGWFALHNKYAVKSETIGQFVGRIDANGKKVFEDDILQMYTVLPDCTREKASKVLLQWCNNDQSYVLETEDGCRYDDFGNYGLPEYCEVIGNIHDNPELLWGKDDGK